MKLIMKPQIYRYCLERSLPDRIDRCSSWVLNPMALSIYTPGQYRVARQLVNRPINVNLMQNLRSHQNAYSEWFWVKTLQPKTSRRFHGVYKHLFVGTPLWKVLEWDKR